MTTTVAMLYPGHAAEDDYELIASVLVAAGTDVRLPVTITEIESDDHTVDAIERRLAHAQHREARMGIEPRLDQVHRREIGHEIDGRGAVPELLELLDDPRF